VVVDIEGVDVSISSHPLDIRGLENKIRERELALLSTMAPESTASPQYTAPQDARGRSLEANLPHPPRSVNPDFGRPEHRFLPAELGRQDSLGMFSKAERAVVDLKQNKGSSQQMLAMSRRRG